MALPPACALAASTLSTDFLFKRDEAGAVGFTSHAKTTCERRHLRLKFLMEGSMDAQKADAWLSLFKEKQALERRVAKLKRSFPGVYIEPSVLMGGELTPRQKMEEALARAEKQLQLVDERLNSLAGEESKDDTRIVWQGSKFEFTETILALHEKGWIQANSPTDALKQASHHFVDRDGRPFIPRSLLQAHHTKLDLSSKRN
jgi:hypothetical protein